MRTQSISQALSQSNTVPVEIQTDIPSDCFYVAIFHERLTDEGKYTVYYEKSYPEYRPLGGRTTLDIENNEAADKRILRILALKILNPETKELQIVAEWKGYSSLLFQTNLSLTLWAWSRMPPQA